MMTQNGKYTDEAKAKLCSPILIKTHTLFVILSLLTLFFLSLIASTHHARSNALISANTPGMLMARIEFELNNPEHDRAISPRQVRLEILNSHGAELMHMKTALDNFEIQAGFKYSKQDKYKRPEDYPRTREVFISEKPKTYAEALARYSRAVYLFKASNSLNEKTRARAHMMVCHKHAQELYKQELATLKHKK